MHAEDFTGKQNLRSDLVKKIPSEARPVRPVGLLVVPFDFDFFLVVGTYGCSSSGALDLVDWNDDFFLSVCDKCVDQTSVESGEQMSQEAVVELAGSVEFFKFQGIEIEDCEPIGAFVVAFDGVGEALFRPKSAHEDFAAKIGDHVLNSAGNSTGISGVVIAIEQKQTFVGCGGQRDYSWLRTTVVFC